MQRTRLTPVTRLQCITEAPNADKISPELLYAMREELLWEPFMPVNIDKDVTPVVCSR